MSSLENTLNYSNPEMTLWSSLFLKMISKITYGEITIQTPEGDVVYYKGKKEGQKVRVEIKDWYFCEDILLRGDIALGASYRLGLWECDDINKLIQFAIENSKELERAIKGSLVKILFYRLKHLLNRNSKKGSLKNIHAHYDLGNHFYKLWLDPSMTYSSALFSGQEDELQVAQKNKYANILKNLNLKSGDHILEVGCGWGGFMEFAAENGVKVTGITISKEQYDYAKKRLDKYGELATVELRDYRDLEGHYDHIVSIEMFEALGEQYWGTYFKKLFEILRPSGNLIIQSITINDQDFSSYRKGTDFIQQYIFPGGMLPSVSAFRTIAQKNGFDLSSEFEFGLDYAKTLNLWDINFMSSLDKVKKLGFDESFIRTWHFYLKYCQGGFEAKKINVFQFNLTRN